MYMSHVKKEIQFLFLFDNRDRCNVKYMKPIRLELLQTE